MRLFIGLIGLLLVGYWFSPMLGFGQSLPGAFSENLTIEQAAQRSSQSGKPILVFATAEWCPPCRELKNGPLRDSRVIEAMRLHTEPVYLDLTDRSSANKAHATTQALGVQGIPTMIVIRNGREIDRRVGYQSSEQIIMWLSRFARPSTVGRSL